MPAYNEAEGLGEFVDEIHGAFDGWTIRFVVVDDCSTDDTAQVAKALAARLPLEFVAMPTNSGHGPATLVALAAGLESGCDIVLAVDGDGQFLGTDLRHVVQTLVAADVDITEGARAVRSQPWFRDFVSAFTRAYVRVRSRESCLDANTPCRAYRPIALSRILGLVPAGSRVPNLWISLLTRHRGFTWVELRVVSLPRRGAVNVGTMWRSRSLRWPSRRFLGFCVASLGELMRPLPRSRS
jgi:dolichol-phosphate mannosyltransferase